ncbi:MAG: anaerobic sulfatase maturase [PVC group bacterium]
MKCFHVMIKPIGPVCNVNCTYCFYLSKERLLETATGWRLPDDLLEKFIRQYIEGQEAEEIVFSWQGGEPTLRGLDFFRKVVALEKRYRQPGIRIENDLQTNGILLDDEWGEFLGKNGFLVGLSIDGPRDLHDTYRVDKKGEGTFDRVLAAGRLLGKHGVTFNSLTVVNRKNAREPLRVYRFLRDVLKSTRIQFIPCVEPGNFARVAPGLGESDSLPLAGSPASRPGSPDSIVTDWSVDPDDFGTFLCRIFDEWYRKDVGRVFVYLFEAALGRWMGMPPSICCQAPVCGHGLALEHDGSVYSCDHYVYPEYRLGNIREEPLAEMAFSPRQREFGSAKSRSLPRQCLRCRFLFVCNGGCPRNRFIRAADDEPGLNYLCRGLYKYFTHIEPYMKKLAAHYGRQQKEAAGFAPPFNL